MTLNETEGYQNPRHSSERSHANLLVDRLTPSGLQHWDSSLKGARDSLGGTELSGSMAKASGAAFAQTEVLAAFIVPLLSLPPPSLHVQTSAISESPSAGLILVHHFMVTPRDTAPPNFLPTQASSSGSCFELS